MQYLDCGHAIDILGDAVKLGRGDADFTGIEFKRFVLFVKGFDQGLEFAELGGFLFLAAKACRIIGRNMAPDTQQQ